VKGYVRPREVATATVNEANGGGRQLRVNVIATTEKGTIAALRAAARLTTNLEAQIILIAVETVPWPCPLEKPPVPVAFLERMLCGLASNAGTGEQEVFIQLYLCRNPRESLRKVLRPESLVLIGGQSRWWSRREWHLYTFLGGLGHRVIFVDVGRAQRDRANVPVNTARSKSMMDLRLGELHYSSGEGSGFSFNHEIKPSDLRRGRK
jgi:hypothetical protein